MRCPRSRPANRLFFRRRGLPALQPLPCSRKNPPYRLPSAPGGMKDSRLFAHPPALKVVSLRDSPLRHAQDRLRQAKGRLSNAPAEGATPPLHSPIGRVLKLLLQQIACRNGGDKVNQPAWSKEAVRPVLRLQRLEISDDRLEELLPYLERAAESWAVLEGLDLNDSVPAHVFKPMGE